MVNLTDSSVISLTPFYDCFDKLCRVCFATVYKSFCTRPPRFNTVKYISLAIRH